MTAEEVRQLRCTLGMTQGQLSQLLGVHGLTVSKWERGLLAPSPYQVAMMQSFHRAAQRQPDIGQVVAGLVVAAGVGIALYYLLRAAFGDAEE